MLVKEFPKQFVIERIIQYLDTREASIERWKSEQLIAQSKRWYEKFSGLDSDGYQYLIDINNKRIKRYEAMLFDVKSSASDTVLIDLDDEMRKLLK